MIGRSEFSLATQRFGRIGYAAQTVLSLWFIFSLSGCGSQPIRPEAENIEVTREPVGENCHSIGPVEGRTISAKGTFDEALENLKLDAARKGANTVKIEATSAIGTAVRGEGFICR